MINVCTNITAIGVDFFQNQPICEGNTGRSTTISYLGTISQTFMATVESYQCSGPYAATRMYYC